MKCNSKIEHAPNAIRVTYCFLELKHEGRCRDFWGSTGEAIVQPSVLQKSAQPIVAIPTVFELPSDSKPKLGNLHTKENT